MREEDRPLTLRTYLAFAIVGLVLIGPTVPCGWAQVGANPGLQGVGDSLTSDFKYLANNVEADGEDIRDCAAAS